MKSKFILAASIAMALATSAQATTTVVLTGATSFRHAIHASLAHLHPSAKIAYTGGTTLDTATQAVFDDNANGVIVLTSFTGSGAGIQALDTNTKVTVINTADSANAGSVGSGTHLSTATTTTVLADAALSDVTQSATAYNSTSLSDQTVGVMPFVWVTNSIGKNLGITNITANFANSTLQDGSTPASFLTGNSADAAKSVYITGRNSGSGTRITTLAEINYPADTNVNQYAPVYTGSIITGLTHLATTAGLSSGGDVATALNASLSSTITNGTKTIDSSKVVLLSYLAYSDAVSVTNGSILNYNGVSFLTGGVPNTNIQNGAYTFWGYEHLLTPSATDNDSDKTAVLNDLVSDIPNFLGTGTQTIGIGLDSMNVQRSGDGQFVY